MSRQQIAKLSSLGQIKIVPSVSTERLNVKVAAQYKRRMKRVKKIEFQKMNTNNRSETILREWPLRMFEIGKHWKQPAFFTLELSQTIIYRRRANE